MFNIIDSAQVTEGKELYVTYKYFLEDIPEPYMFRVLFIYTPIGFSINSRSVVHLECARTY